MVAERSGAGMSRQYDERIEVQVGEPLLGRLPESVELSDAGAEVPTAFLWRGRVHVVRAVVAHWTQRLPWWRSAWEDSCAPQVLEHRVWRVEASAGRSQGTGVYDLAQGEHWQLVRVAD